MHKNATKNSTRNNGVFFCGYKITNDPFSIDLFSSQYNVVEDCFSTPHTQPTVIGFSLRNIKWLPLFRL
jgi:hypothetical protein